MVQSYQRPTQAFVLASWAALLAGMGAFLIGLYNLDTNLTLKGFYFTLLMYGLFAAASLQKSVRDRLEGIHVTAIYFGLCWFSVGLVILLLTIGLLRTDELGDSDKGFYAMSFLLALFGLVAVQKNIRDILSAEKMARQRPGETQLDA